jgi:CubicO group peptidase (beta-lactamase class C family)
VLVGRRGRVVYARAFGRRAVEPRDEPMTRDTAFDLASLTKPVATATSVMILVERGELRLDDRLGRLLPSSATAARARSPSSNSSAIAPA